MELVTIIGDSLTMVRPADGISRRHLYSTLLNEQLGHRVHVINHGMRANTSHLELALLDEHVQVADSRFFVVQLGIVDCSPRLLSHTERWFVAMAMKCPGLRCLAGMFVKHRSSHRLAVTRHRPLTEVPIADFAANMRRLMREIITANPGATIFLINIAYPGTYLRQRSFGIVDNVTAYNQVLTEIANELPDVVRIIDFFHDTQQHPEHILACDGHHVTREGHRHLASVLAANINALI